MKSARAIVQSITGGNPALRGGAEIAFLPAALELVENPPSPIGRAIGGTIIALFCAALAWASIGKIDIVATATGKIVPSGRVKVIQPFETGVVRAIHVRDGDAVKAGDVLVELDPTINAAESGRIDDELIVKELDVARLRALTADAGDPKAAFTPPAGASPSQIDLQWTLLADQIQSIQAKLAGIDRQITQNEAGAAGAEAEVQKLTLAIPLLQQRVAIFKDLLDQGWGQRPQYLELEQEVIEHQQDLRAQSAKVRETNAAIAALREQRIQTEAEFRRTNLSDLAEAEQKAGSLRSQLVQAQERTKLQVLTAPVDGTVQQLQLHTVGGVVTPAQSLLVVVPDDSKLEVEAMVSNRDVGFVFPGQDVEVKVDAFDFTRYGLFHGKVLNVSSDAIPRNNPTDQRTDLSPPDSSEPKGQELVYAARISLDRTNIQVDDRLVDLSPGMAVTAEVKTGSRRIIDYLLSPLLRVQQASLRER
jgi:hemolysin D